MPTHVLLVEDDPDIAPVLVRALERERHVVSHVSTGRAAVDRVGGEHIDVVLLDLGLPDIDGLEACRLLRAEGYQGAIIMLTARDGELDRVVGLDVGADDYLSKPFSLSELLARIRATLRRGWAVEPGPVSQAAPSATAPTPTAAAATPGAAAAPGEPPPASAARSERALVVDPRSRRAFSGTGEIALTAKEFDVLALLDAERGAVISREQLMNEVWDENWYGSTKTLDATVGRLRQKLESASSPVRIATVRGVGFRLEDEPPEG